jgi:D-arabinitol dehydrogenase (NADP+)
MRTCYSKAWSSLFNIFMNSTSIFRSVSYCGVCGTDGHIHDGEFIAKFPLIPGHEAVGSVVEVGKDVKGFEVGDRCAADVGITVRQA